MAAENTHDGTETLVPPFEDMTDMELWGHELSEIQQVWQETTGGIADEIPNEEDIVATFMQDDVEPLDTQFVREESEPEANSDDERFINDDDDDALRPSLFVRLPVPQPPLVDEEEEPTGIRRSKRSTRGVPPERFVCSEPKFEEETLRKYEADLAADIAEGLIDDDSMYEDNADDEDEEEIHEESDDDEDDGGDSPISNVSADVFAFRFDGETLVFVALDDQGFIIESSEDHFTEADILEAATTVIGNTTFVCKDVVTDMAALESLLGIDLDNARVDSRLDDYMEMNADVEALFSN
jgi:hypothetical protein